MKYCDKCNIKIETHNSYCPLCQQTLSGQTNIEHIEKYPEYISPTRKLYPLTKKIILFVTIVSIIVLLVINLATYKENPAMWSLIPIGGIAYFWFLVTLGILSRHNIAFKFAALTTLLIGLLILIDFRSDGGGWSYNYVMPLLLTLCNLSVSVIILIKRMDYRDYIVYLLMIVVFSIVPLVLLLVNVIDEAWPALVSFGLAIFILSFIIFFFPKSIKDEIKKRFHA